MEALQELIPIALQISLFLIGLAIGLDASIDDADYVLKRPRLLLRSLAAIIVIVPAFAALLVAALPLPSVVEIGILLMAISPLPPIVPGTEMKLGGHKPYVYGLLVAIALLSILTVPITVAFLGAAFGVDASIGSGAVARLALISVILPLGVGLAIRRVRPSLSKRMGPIVRKSANIMLIVSILPVLIAAFPAIAHLIGNGSVIAIAAVAVVGLLAGHLLGGPDPSDRLTLGISSAMRHPGIAMLIAGANFSDPQVRAAILLFLIVGLLVSTVYQTWYKRRRPELSIAIHGSP